MYYNSPWNKQKLKIFNKIRFLIYDFAIKTISNCDELPKYIMQIIVKVFDIK